MKSTALLLFVGLLLLLSGGVHAEGNCPEGYYPIGAEPGQPGPQGCAPIPGFNQQQGQPQGQPQPMPPPPQWASRWGAIATDMAHSSAGAAVNQPSQRQAEQAALAECKSNGGITCKVDLAYHDQCAAMVVSGRGYDVQGAATIDEAIRLGTKVCKESGAPDCHTYYSSCSLPVRVN